MAPKGPSPPNDDSITAYVLKSISVGEYRSPRILRTFTEGNIHWEYMKMSKERIGKPPDPQCTGYRAVRTDMTRYPVDALNMAKDITRRAVRATRFMSLRLRDLALAQYEIYRNKGFAHVSVYDDKTSKQMKHPSMTIRPNQCFKEQKTISIP